MNFAVNNQEHFHHKFSYRKCWYKE